MEQDDIQIDALDFDPDIDRPDIQWMHHTTAVVSVHELLTSPDPESVNASNPKEEIADRDWLKTRYPIAEDGHWSHNLPQQVSNHPVPGIPTTPQQVRTTEHNSPEEIPQLEEEVWKNGQFADADKHLIDRHNTHAESERIQMEYMEQLFDLTDNQYYSEEHPLAQLQYSIPDPDYYGSQSRRLNTHNNSHDPVGYYPPPPRPSGCLMLAHMW